MKKLYYPLFWIKRYIEQIIMFPFVQYGKWIARNNPLSAEYDFFFFLPSYQIGGAERVNAEILNAVGDKKVFIAFSKYSKNDGMLHFFKKPNVDVEDIHKRTDNKKKYYGSFIERGRFAYYINKQKKSPVVFIGQSNFGYKLLPHIKKRVYTVDLIHMHDSKFTWVWAPFLQFIDKRVVVDTSFITKFARVHNTFGIPEGYMNKYVVIPYCLEYIPDHKFVKEFNKPLKVYYAGRGGRQKRLWILFDIIKECKRLDLPIVFKLAGSFEDELPEELRNDYVGELPGGEAVYNFHKENDILLMTSAFEGFPITILEAIAFGSPILAPAVDAIPSHIVHEKNGFLITEVLDEKKMAHEVIDLLQKIVADRYDLKDMSDQAFDMINQKFTRKKFGVAYRSLFNLED